MKKPMLILCTALVGLSVTACAARQAPPAVVPKPAPAAPQQTVVGDETLVRETVEKFGAALQMVSLQAPKDVLKKSMQDSYSAYVSPQLLTRWESDPLKAPGRLTSSPWPDRIRIASVEKASADSYVVKAEIIEITSTEKPGTGEAAKRPVTLTVRKSGSRWLIDDASLGEYQSTASVVYSNTQYGFSIELPASWQGYKIVTSKWDGLATGGAQNGKVVETGPLLLVRHPEWTTQKPRQDIPVQVFTLSQWNQMQQGKFHIGAAPIGPKELGRNAKHVFALPARYNFAFPEGYQEVEKILEAKSFRAQ